MRPSLGLQLNNARRISVASVRLLGLGLPREENDWLRIVIAFRKISQRGTINSRGTLGWQPKQIIIATPYNGNRYFPFAGLSLRIEIVIDSLTGLRSTSEPALISTSTPSRSKSLLAKFWKSATLLAPLASMSTRSTETFIEARQGRAQIRDLVEYAAQASPMAIILR